MTKCRFAYIILALAAALPTAGAQRNESTIQPVQEDFQLGYWNIRTFGKHPHWELYDPSEDGAYAGVWEPEREYMEPETIVTYEGILGYRIPANKPHVVGITMARPLYETSPGSAWQDFGKRMKKGKMLPQSVNPASWTVPHNTNQFENIPTADLWNLVGGDPYTITNWSGALPGLPSFNGEDPWGFLAPFGPGHFFQQVQPFLPGLPPSVGPGGGNLVGMNLVLQVGVLDTNVSTATAPKFTLTNAIGIQAMAGPPIKLNAGNGGNWGPELANIDFEVERPNNSMSADVPLTDGTDRNVPMDVVNGTTIRMKIPEGADSGVITVRSDLGEVPYLKRPIMIVTHGDVQDLAVTSTPDFTVETDDDGCLVFGTSVVGTLSQLSSGVVNVPIPSWMNQYDLTIQVYPLDKSAMYAGIGTTVPVNLNVSLNTLAPALIASNPMISPLANDAVVLEDSYDNLTGPVDVNFSTNLTQNYDFLAIIKATEKP